MNRWIILAAVLSAIVILFRLYASRQFWLCVVVAFITHSIALIAFGGFPL